MMICYINAAQQQRGLCLDYFLSNYANPGGDAESVDGSCVFMNADKVSLVIPI